MSVRLKKYDIRSVSNFIGLIEAKREILQIPAFMVFNSVIAELTAPGCRACKRKKIIETYKLQFDMSMGSLSPSEKESLKTILNTEQITYNVIEDGRIVQKTI